jgi:hypothetical protein
MKKSAKITLTLAAAAGMAACNRQRPPDPCEAASFNEQACNEAVRSGGYHYNGTWMPMYYSHPYPWYYDSYRSHVSRGGSVFSAPSSSYARPSSGGSSSGVSRGGFGSTGAGHASGGGSGAGS